MTLASTGLSLRMCRMLIAIVVGVLDFFSKPSLAFHLTSTVFDRDRSRMKPISKNIRSESLLRSSWSKIAEFDADSGSFRLVDTTNVVDASDFATLPTTTKSSSSAMEYDLSSPREWLEFCEANQPQDDELPPPRREDRLHNNLEEREACGGAYTVLRCDFRLDQKDWKIWGKDFHRSRLRESYRLLLQQRKSMATKNTEPDIDEEWEQAALDSSREAMTMLLVEAERSILSNKNDKTGQPIERGRNAVVVVMLTLLWDPAPKNASGIRVRGHGFSTMKASRLVGDDVHDNGDGAAMGNPNAPIQAVIGHLPPDSIERITNHYDNSPQEGTTMLPNRYQNSPQAKLSSWCRRRRLLESTFKKHNAGDVILTKQCETDDDPEPSKTGLCSIELLEGLTSNLFVVYPGKVLRTAPSSHVLGGYARGLIIQCAEECGYRVEIGPVPLEDSSQWKEVFLTSSIRLIIPVHKLLLPNTTNHNQHDDNNDNTELFQLDSIWEIPLVEESEGGASDTFYQKLMKQEL
eukprot:jgi/Psemu1/286987/fgenesh1_pg.167_\